MKLLGTCFRCSSRPLCKWLGGKCGTETEAPPYAPRLARLFALKKISDLWQIYFYFHFKRTSRGEDRTRTAAFTRYINACNLSFAALRLRLGLGVPPLTDVLTSRSPPAAPVFTFLRRLDDVPGEIENGERMIPCRAGDPVVSDVMSVDISVLAEMRGSSSSL